MNIYNVFHVLTIFYCVSSLIAGNIAASISVTCLLVVADIGLLLSVLMLILALLITVIDYIKQFKFRNLKED